MRLRGVPIAASVLVWGAALPGLSLAQCVSVGPPGSSGCGPGGSPPTIVCVGIPSPGAYLSHSVSPPAGGQWNSLFATFYGPCDPLTPPAPVHPYVCPAAPSGCSLAVDLAQLFAVQPVGCGYSPCTYGLGFIPNVPSVVGTTTCIQVIGLAYTNLFSSCFAISNGLSITIL